MVCEYVFSFNTFFKKHRYIEYYIAQQAWHSFQKNGKPVFCFYYGSNRKTVIFIEIHTGADIITLHTEGNS